MSNNNSGNSNSNNRSADFLLAEFERLRELFIENEKSGENRTNFLIGLVTAVSGIFAVLGVFVGKSDIVSTWAKSLFNITSPDLALLSLTLCYALIVYAMLFLFGFMTLRRLIIREDSRERQKKQLDCIRLYFLEKDPTIEKHIPYKIDDDVCDKEKGKETEVKRKGKGKEKEMECKLFSFGKGGWLVTVQLINSILIGLITLVITLLVVNETQFKTSNIILVIIYIIPAVLGFIVAWYLQYKHIHTNFVAVASVNEIPDGKMKHVEVETIPWFKV